MQIANRSTAIGAFPSRSEAEQAVCALLVAGFRVDQLGIVLPDAESASVGSGEAGSITLWVGKMFRSLIGVEFPDEEIRYYEEALEGGQSLLMVRSKGRFPEAIDVLHRSGGQYMPPY
jgi:hypothetical protein